MENFRNPFSSDKEIGSSSKMQNTRNPYSFGMETGSSSSSSSSVPTDYNPVGIGSSSSSSVPNDYNPVGIGKTIIDPLTGDTYLLKKEIGSSCNGFCHVYRALYSRYLDEKGILVQSGLVTLKIINKNFQESRQLQDQIHTSITYTPYINLIGLKRTITTNELVCVSLPYMSEGSLRYMLSTRPEKKLTEDFIVVVLKEVLIGLRDELHVDFNSRSPKTLNAGDIFVHIEDNGEMLIKLAFEASVYDSEEMPNLEEPGLSSSFLDPLSIFKWGAAPEVFETEVSTVESDIWLLGITALELAYGELPVRNRGDFDCIIEKIRENKKLPRSLEKLLIFKKKKGKFKKMLDLIKRKKRVFSKEFEKMVIACLCENPDNRPTVDQILNTPLFTTPIERFKQFVLIGMNPEPTDY